MPYGEVRLVAGVNVERTPTLNEAGISESQLVRFKDGLVQKYGGWEKFYPSAVDGVPRDLHAWADLNGTPHLAIGTTTRLDIITSGTLTDITPQTVVSDFAPNFSTVAGSATITVVDSNISQVTPFDTVLFNTPVSVGGIVLSGVYQIATIVGSSSYTITASSAATSTVSNGGVVPVFSTTVDSSFVTVALANHGLTLPGQVYFNMDTTGNGITVGGYYSLLSIVDADHFQIAVDGSANATSSFSMNGGNAELLYYINLGPPTGSGFGLGGYGLGGYGLGVTATPQTGTPLAATDYTTDNWGQILLACPENGGVYQFDPTGGFDNAALVATAPPFNTGIFVSTRQQILVCYGSSVTQTIGVQQDKMLVKWSDLGDYTNFTPTISNQARSFRIPIGSMIKSGMAAQNQNLFWTDLDLWASNYQGPPFVFGFNMIGAGAGAISSHSPQKFRGSVYWMGPTNFYVYDSGGVKVMPCSVWDAVFQNLNTDYAHNVRAMPNTPFNEVGWLYPSSASVSGECDSYVKVNITEQGTPWDYGLLPRSSWIDQTVLGNPIAASPSGIIYQQETTNNADGAALTASFVSGYFYIAEGEDFAIVDQILPDFKWATYGVSPAATISLTINAVNFPGDTPITFGPYSVTVATQIVAVRIRARQMSFTVQSSDLGSFWRLGKVRYRYAPDGRR